VELFNAIYVHELHIVYAGDSSGRKCSQLSVSSDASIRIRRRNEQNVRPRNSIHRLASYLFHFTLYSMSVPPRRATSLHRWQTISWLPANG